VMRGIQKLGPLSRSMLATAREKKVLEKKSNLLVTKTMKSERDRPQSPSTSIQGSKPLKLGAVSREGRFPYSKIGEKRLEWNPSWAKRGKN